MSDLFDTAAKKPRKGGGEDYTATDIEVLEGLEPVRKRPGMYIGGTDDRAMHHLVSEILDNAMDEAVAGHASRIELTMLEDGSITVTDNGRGIPVDEHPKFPGKSALEIILTTLHSGGKFSGKAYATSGGLHGVGSSVVNALSDKMVVEVARGGKLYRQTYSRGKPTSKLQNAGAVSNRRGTSVTFHPDPEIFGAKAKFHPSWLYRLARSKAYLFKGVEIRWSCPAELLGGKDDVPQESVLSFPNGLLDYLNEELDGRKAVTPTGFYGVASFADDQGRAEFAIAWPVDGEGFTSSYCNTIPTPLGGTHESGLRSGLLRSLKGYGEMTGVKKAGIITSDDVLGGAAAMLSVFIRDPQFQGQTKEKLASAHATRLVENAVKDHCDHWLVKDPAASKQLLEFLIERAEERQRSKDAKEQGRKSATRRLNLPGKLADCSRKSSEDTEIFIVEGDSAGGSAKQARNRETQAVLPLRGKVLNVASASLDKIRANQEINDLIQALGCGAGKDFDIERLRYERIIIMTDADVDGAHIASLLITLFYKQMRPLIERGHLFLGMPPLYRLSGGGKVFYARDDAHKDELMKTEFKGKGKIEISRFKGLGEMPASQLKETAMDPKQRGLMRIVLPGHAHGPDELEAGDESTEDLIERLMGKSAEARFEFIQANAKFVQDIDV